MLGFEIARQNISTGRAFCLTTNGFMGFSPKATAPGDDICVFFGNDVLFVVRLLPNRHYRLIGECYIYGLMHGEVMKGLDENLVIDLVLK